LLANAEAALRQAQRSGERRLVFSPAMAAAAGNPPPLVQQLRQALARQEFVLHYQPKVDLVSGRVTGAEALLRWSDPSAGPVAPSRLIPALEQAGLMRQVGRWALRQALADARRWRSAGSGPLRVAVNISAQQWRQRDFTAEIAQLIAGDAAVAGQLSLDLTESLLMADLPHSIASLKALRAMGVATSVDDFGTGYSSLSCLSRLPLDTLKIDGCFVARMTTGPEGLALISTLIQLAHSLKLEVVAEGVQTAEQSRLLRLLGCEAMQGFVVGEAVAGEAFAGTYLSAPDPA
jgi:EAL domain-containing protein (putative c-di-GMP-specific phosphodiesterase class I)